MMEPNCIHCRGVLYLASNFSLNYRWKCENGCRETIDTGVPTQSDILPFQQEVVANNGNLDGQQLCQPALSEHISGLKVYMPQILYHYIECSWGACYSSIYAYCLKPYLDSPNVLDYVLRSPVIYCTKDSWVGLTGAMIYPELFEYLSGVDSPMIRQYLRENFEQSRH